VGGGGGGWGVGGRQGGGGGGCVGGWGGGGGGALISKPNVGHIPLHIRLVSRVWAPTSNQKRKNRQNKKRARKMLKEGLS